MSWTDCLRNEEILQEGSILHDMKRRKANWIDHILHRNCLLNHVIKRIMEGRIEVTGRREQNVGSYWMTLREGEDSVN